MNATSRLAALLCITTYAHAGGGAPELLITSVVPGQNAVAGIDTDVVIDFDRSLWPASLTAGPNHFHVFGEQSGPIAGTLIFENADSRLRFDPQEDFFAGETVRVTISRFVAAADGGAVRSAGFHFEFRTQPAPAQMDFAPVDGINMRQTPGEAVRVYGGLSADFDDDGYLDLAIINEDSGDCRLIFNRGDASGHFHDLTGPILPLGLKPSPNQTADFNLDGVLDIVAANTDAADVSVLFGIAGGGFAPTLSVPADNIPRGMAVLDANGDGFVDIATANLTDTSGTVAVMINDGVGGFLPPFIFDSGITFEVALDAPDMNNDGIMDLVVGGLNSQTVCVLIGNGDGTFAPGGPQATGGSTWRLLCGDLNGDGFMDVTTANGLSGNGAILLNDGTGTLSPATVAISDSFTTYTDLGDLDGDGDLDWILSNFSGGTYKIFTNDGAGAFTLSMVLPAIDRPAGVVMMDFDNDEDLDLVLMDEFADIITLLENQASYEDLFCFGDGTPCPCGNAGDPGHGCNVGQATGGVNVAPVDFAPLGGTGSVTLVATGFPSMGSPAIIPIRSTVRANGGQGSTFGDGLLCVGPPVVRLAARFASGGAATLPINHGAMAGAGTFHYQLWFRSVPLSFCDATAAFNLSNGVTLVWP